MIAAGADPNAVSDTGHTVLRAARSAGDDESVRLLIAAGADSTMRPADGWTRLHGVAARGAPAEAKALVVAGADLSTRDRIGRSALHIAAGYGNTATLRELIALGADPSARTNAGLTPLHYSEDLESTRALVAAGADLDARDEDGDTPLHDLLASASLRPREAVSDYPELVKVMLAAGADPNVRNDPSWGTALVSTPLHEAAESSHPELVEVVRSSWQARTPRHATSSAVGAIGPAQPVHPPG